MTIEAMATQIMAELDLHADYSTRRLVLLGALKKAREMAFAECAEIAHSFDDPRGHGKEVADAIRQRT